MSNFRAGGNTAIDAAVTKGSGTISNNAVTTSVPGSDYGAITTGALSTAADAWEAAVTWTDGNIAATSDIELTIESMTGVPPTNGVPHAIVSAKTAGSCTLRIGNIGTQTLSGAFVIGYRIYNTH